MKKRKIIKLGYKQIVKERQSHQEVFDNLILDKTNSKKEVAALLSVIPSSAKQKEFANLRYVYIALLVLIFVVRMYAMVLFYIHNGWSEAYGDNGSVLLQGLFEIVLVAILFSAFASGLGIYAAIFAKQRLYQSVGIILGIGIVKSFESDITMYSTETIIVYGGMILAIALSFYIPFKLKTTYNVVKEQKEINGVKKMTINYVFEKENNAFDDVLDSDMI